MDRRVFLARGLGVVEHERRVGAHREGRIHHRCGVVVIDLDQRGRVGCGGLALGHHGHHGLADVEDSIDRERKVGAAARELR